MAVKKTKISQMPEQAQLKGTEWIPIVDGSDNKKVKADKLLTPEQAEELYQTKGDYLVESDLTDYAKVSDLDSKLDIDTYNQDKSTFALKSELPDTSDMLTETEADGKYQVKGDYALKSELPTDYLTEDEANGLYQSKLISGTNIKTINGQSLLGGGNISITEGGEVVDTGIPDAPNNNKLYGRKNANWEEIVIPDVSDFITETEADGKYQAKGDYALKSEIPTDYLTEETAGGLYQAKGDYALKSEIPNVDDFITETDADERYATVSSLENKLDKTTYEADKETFATKTDIDDMLTKTEAEQSYQEKGDYLTEIPNDVVRLTAAKDIILPINGSITMIQDESAGSGGVIICQRDYGEGNVTEVGNARNKLTLNATERPQIDVAGGQEKMAYVSDVDEVRANFDTINFVQKNITNYELQVGDRIAGSVDISKVGMYYPGVKVDTQKLFALTKGSTEDEIKAALQLETSSGSYTLPTAEILDNCIGKGYQLLSNWMPVSVTWNGAGYVLYIIGQNYMNKPNGLYTVTIKITDGVYSVFQAAKFVEFASKDYVDQVAGDKTNVLILSLENDLANGEKAQPVTPEISEKLVDAVDTGKACVIKTANSDILANLQKIGDNVTIIMEQVSRISTYFIAVNTAITVNTVSNIIADYSTGAINLADSSTLATKEEVQNKQDKLISGTNIKTVNGNTLLGEGDITIDVPDTSDMLTKTEAASIYAKNSDLVYIADTVIPQMNTNTAKALDQKVDWDEEKKVISLPADGSISALRNAETLEGGVLLAQRTYDGGATYVTEVGTTKNSLTLNSTQRPKVDLQGGTSEELAYVDDLRTLPVEINIPIRSLKDQIYDQSTILGWFGVEEVSDLKKLIASGGIQYLRYGITLTGTPRYYKMPVEYVAFESNNQIKLVCLGLDTTDDSPTRYTFILNLDGTIASGNSNVSMTLDPIKVDLSNYYTKEEVDSKYQAKLTAGNGISIEDGVISSTLDVNLFRVVSALPEEDIETDKIYLVPSSTTGENNVYTEYTYVNSAWEKLGEYNSNVDLTDYLTKEEATELYQPVGDYATKTELNSKLDVETYNQEKAGFLTAVPSEYITETELEEKDYITSTEASETYQPKGNYATLAQVQAKQDQLVSGVNIKTVNGASLLGSGDITIETPEGGIPDAAQDNKIYGRCNGSWVEIPSLSTVDGGTYTTEVANAIDTQALMSTFALKSAIPTKVSELENDSIYVTDEELEEKMKTKVTGVGLTTIKVVEELPEIQEKGVLYLVTGKEE